MDPKCAIGGPKLISSTEPSRPIRCWSTRGNKEESARARRFKASLFSLGPYNNSTGPVSNHTIYSSFAWCNQSTASSHSSSLCGTQSSCTPPESFGKGGGPQAQLTGKVKVLEMVMAGADYVRADWDEKMALVEEIYRILSFSSTHEMTLHS